MKLPGWRSRRKATGPQVRNHEALMRELAREVGRAKRYRHSLALLVISVPEGRSTPARGGAVLEEQEPEEGLRQVDQFFSIDNNSYALICPHASHTDAPGAARRLIASIVKAGGYTRGACVGSAAYPSDALDAGTLLQRAKTACAVAVSLGSGQAVAWHELPEAQSAPQLEDVWQSLAMGDLSGFETIRAYLEDGSRLGELGERRRLGDRLAAQLGLSQLERNALQGSLLLYDLGRIGVLDAIWDKEGPLSAQETVSVRTHPQLAASLLHGHQATAPLLPSILYHHERFDGAGYPDGLKGNDIPRLARIVHVIDAYLAMTNDRPYRTALGQKRAVQELWRGAGSQFDPEVVQALASIQR
jgi:hypothetical protein